MSTRCPGRAPEPAFRPKIAGPGMRRGREGAHRHTVARKSWRTCALVGLPPPRPPSVPSTSLIQSPAGRKQQGVRVPGQPRMGQSRPQMRQGGTPATPPPGGRPATRPTGLAAHCCLLHTPCPCPCNPASPASPPADSCLEMSCGTPAYASALSSPAVRNMTGSEGCFFWMAFHASCLCGHARQGRAGPGVGGVG